MRVQSHDSQLSKDGLLLGSVGGHTFGNWGRAHALPHTPELQLSHQRCKPDLTRRPQSISSGCVYDLQRTPQPSCGLPVRLVNAALRPFWVCTPMASIDANQRQRRPPNCVSREWIWIAQRINKRTLQCRHGFIVVALLILYCDELPIDVPH